MHGMDRIVKLPHKDADVSEQFEEGMCYRVTLEDGRSHMLFRHGGSAMNKPKPEERDRNRCFTKMLLTTNNGGSLSRDTKPWVVDRHCKRATVEEEIWYDECDKANRPMEQKEALEIFEKRYKI